MSEQGEQLHSWKDIAAFFGVHERTVMRWEESRKLPVHRVGGHARDAVFANTAELKDWAASGKNRGLTDEPNTGRRESRPNGHSPVVREEGSVVVSPVAVRADGRLRRWLLAAAAVAVLTFLVTAVALWQSPSDSVDTVPGQAPVPSGTLQRVAAARSGEAGARVVVLKISNPDGSGVELALPDGVTGRTGGTPAKPALLLRPRLANARLQLEIERQDGEPVVPHESLGSPLVITLSLGVRIRVLNPYPFDVEWIRTEAPNSQR
jgi:hypothetical protein